MLDATGDGRWADVWSAAAEALLGRRDPGGLWTQRLYGETSRGLVVPHGLVGNVLALRDGRELLADESRERLVADTRAILERNVVVESELANWPMEADGSLQAADGEQRIQWDYGAPGIVTSAASDCIEARAAMPIVATWD